MRFLLSGKLSTTVNTKYKDCEGHTALHFAKEWSKQGETVVVGQIMEDLIRDYEKEMITTIPARRDTIV